MSVWLVSQRTIAVSAAKLTDASRTPGCRLSCISTAAAQLPQCMPSTNRTLSCSVCGAGIATAMVMSWCLEGLFQFVHCPGAAIAKTLIVFFNNRDINTIGIVAPFVTCVREYGGNFFRGQGALKRRHNAIISSAGNFNFSAKSIMNDGQGQIRIVCCHPLAASQRWECARYALAGGLVTGRTMSSKDLLTIGA